MSPAELLRDWLAYLAALELETDVLDNMMCFSLGDAQDARVSPSELAGFLRDAHRAYSLAASRAGRTGYFYAWHDEQAGQLRTCAAFVASTAELPFRRALEILDDPLPLAAECLADAYAHGLPMSELRELTPAEAAADDLERARTPLPPLPVYARPLITST